MTIRKHTATKPLVAYKGFNLDEKGIKCRDKYFKVGQTHSIPSNVAVKICNSGWHACSDLKHVKDYYNWEIYRVFGVVEQWGNVDVCHTTTKQASKHIKVVRLLTIQEYFDMTKTGKTDKRVQSNATKAVFTPSYAALDEGDPILVINSKKDAVIFCSNSEYKHIGTSSAVATIIGNDMLYKGVKGCVFVDIDNNAAVAVDGKKIKENTFYKCLYGTFKEAGQK